MNSLALFSVALDSSRTVAKTGSFKALNAWATKQGLRFKRDSSLFGGYYVNDTTGAAYVCDIV